MEQKLQQLYDDLLTQLQNRKERYVLDVQDQHGTRRQTVNREQYLEHLLGYTIHELDCILDELCEQSSL